MKNRLIMTFVLLSGLLGGANQALSQAVAVTLRLDTNTIGICETTTLRVYAQVVPALRPTADRIFSWYVDVLNTNGLVVLANYSALVKSTSDNDPETSSTGFTDGAHRRGIYDTFVNLPGAGTTNAVELLAIPLTGLRVGQTSFRVQHGTGVPNLSEDFIVAPQGGGNPSTGGDYTLAQIGLNVVSNATTGVKRLSIAHEKLSGTTNKSTLTFNGVAGCDCFVEHRTALGVAPTWQAFPGGPHNQGVYRDTNNLPTRFYRLRAVPAN